jgi:hypothetical protein
MCCATTAATFNLCYVEHIRLGVRALAHSRGLLLSASFDWTVVVWDVQRLERFGTLTGHTAPVAAVQTMADPTAPNDIKAVTLDDAGVCVICTNTHEFMNTYIHT